MTIGRRELYAIALALSRSKPIGEYETQAHHDQWNEDVAQIAVALATINPLFKPAVFAAACQGVPKHG